jgi:hypothetical protein
VRRAVAAVSIVVIACAAAAAYAWQQLQPPRISPPEQNWQATVAVLAGDGVPGAIDGLGLRARFAEPFGIAAAPDGTIFVTDAGHADRIRRVAPDGAV